MRFEFYTEALENVPKLSVDGTVDNSIHFSHWEGNSTPTELKADTSTEIALNLVASPNRAALTEGIELVTNNHFDTDGVLSCWTVLTGERALAYRDLLISAAEAGDFSEYSSDDGVRVSIAIQGSDQASPNNDDGSPLARLLAGEEVDDDARAYDLVLPKVEHLLANINEYESLWREGWERVVAAIQSFEKGESKVVEQADISVITLAQELFDGAGFSPTRQSAPYTAISKYAKGELFLIGIPTTSGWFYRLDYPYYSWAETVVRPRIQRRALAPALQLLNVREGNRDGRWQTDNSEMTSAVKFLDSAGTVAASRLEPDEVAEVFAAVVVARGSFSFVNGMHDVIIIGAGPAGLSTAFWCDELGLDTLVLEQAEHVGGQLHRVYNPINNYLGLKARNGEELLERFTADVENADFDLWTQTSITSVDLKAKRVSLASGEELKSIALVIATGVRPRELGVPGEKEFTGKGMIESGTRDRELFAGQDVCVVGGGDAAVENALLLAESCPTVTLVHRGKKLRARREFTEQLQSKHCITVFTESVLTRIMGQDRVEAVEIQRRQGLKPFQLAVRGVLIRIGVEPNTELFKEQLETDSGSYIIVNSQQETNVPMVFAVGDVSNPVAPTISGAAGAGATAAKIIASRFTR